jgi:hypothetical protein
MQEADMAGVEIAFERLQPRMKTSIWLSLSATIVASICGKAGTLA